MDKFTVLEGVAALGRDERRSGELTAGAPDDTLRPAEDPR